MIIFFKTILYLVQGTTLLIAFIKRKNLKNTSLRYFLYYLIFVFIGIEVSANLVRQYTDFKNYFIYNIYDIVTYIFFLFWFYRILNKKKIKVLFLIYFIFLFISLFSEGFFRPLNINFYTGTIIILILVYTYFSSLLQKKEVVNFTKLPEFWISTGLLIYHVGFLPIYFSLNFKGSNNAIYIQLINSILNILLYGCFIKAFLCQKKI